MYSEIFRNKISQQKIQGQIKPFIDKNLQMQIPGLENVNLLDRPHTPIYIHFIRNPSPFYLDIGETQLFQAMEEAEKSHKAWLKMKELLQKTIQDFSKF